MLPNIKKEKYPFLKEPFKEWFLDRYKEAENYDLKTSPELLESLKISEEEFLDLFIKPYEFLTLEQVKQILAHQEKHFRDRKIPQPSPFGLEIKIQENTKINALIWLLVNVNDLNFFEFDSELIVHYWKPYKQCHYCGKPDFYLHRNGKMRFHNRTRFCHSNSCNNREKSNPQYHEECCYGHWNLKKKALGQRIKLATGHKSKIDYFIDFCEEQLNQNLTIQWTVQPEGEEESRAYNLSEFWTK